MFEQSVSYDAAYTHVAPAREAEIAIALRWLAEHKGASGPILVVAPGKPALEEAPLIRRLGSSLDLRTERTFKTGSSRWNGGVALALWPTTSIVETLDGHRGTTALAVVPWLFSDIEIWIRARRPVDLLGVAPQAAEPHISDPVVRVALESLTIAVNLSSGLSHGQVPCDRDVSHLETRWAPVGCHRSSRVGVGKWLARLVDGT